MQINTMIRAGAEVASIVTLHKGDVYKRLHKAYGDEVQLRFGVVEDLMSNGEDAGFTALEYVVTYGTPTVELKVYTSLSDLQLFPATPDEFRAHLREVSTYTERAVRDAERAWAKARELNERVRALGVRADELTAPETAVPAIEVGVVLPSSEG